MAEPLRLYTECACDAPTLSDYFTRFADDKRLLLVFAARVPLAFFAIYCASCIVVGGAPLQERVRVAVCAGATVNILYTFVGGFLAVNWTDTLQATQMIFALLVPAAMVCCQSSAEPVWRAAGSSHH